MSKKERNEDFDDPMGCFFRPDVCELLRSYILQQLSQLFEHHSVGLYKDDGLAVLKGLLGPETERVNKAVINVYKLCARKITIKTNLHIMNFLDITLDLRNHTCQPCRKADNHSV